MNDLELVTCSLGECTQHKTMVLSQQVAFHQCKIDVHDVYTWLDLYYLIRKGTDFSSELIHNNFQLKLRTYVNSCGIIILVQ
jgi:hypothetical protein